MAGKAERKGARRKTFTTRFGPAHAAAETQVTRLSSKAFVTQIGGKRVR